MEGEDLIKYFRELKIVNNKSNELRKLCLYLEHRNTLYIMFTRVFCTFALLNKTPQPIYIIIKIHLQNSQCFDFYFLKVYHRVETCTLI